MSEPKYKRVLLKISGEALAGDAHRGLDFDVIGGVCDVIRQTLELTEEDILIPFSAEKGVGKDELLGVLVNACGG